MVKSDDPSPRQPPQPHPRHGLMQYDGVLFLNNMIAYHDFAVGKVKGWLLWIDIVDIDFYDLVWQPVCHGGSDTLLADLIHYAFSHVDLDLVETGELCRRGLHLRHDFLFNLKEDLALSFQAWTNSVFLYHKQISKELMKQYFLLLALMMLICIK
ncbi:hypothetical protein Tco_1185647 [Tanacetum coccineum]